MKRLARSSYEGLALLFFIAMGTNGNKHRPIRLYCSEEKKKIEAKENVTIPGANR
jgi:hypothetical protein